MGGLPDMIRIMTQRKLTLRKETLSALDPDELASVVAGNSGHCVTFSVIITGCYCGGLFPSLNIDCRTVKCL
jgi:hypothetical protein